jgi:hypothetical protein
MSHTKFDLAHFLYSHSLQQMESLFLADQRFAKPLSSLGACRKLAKASLHIEPNIEIFINGAC